ncbi:MAG: lipoprotein [Bacilli bacterium]|nr:lipoprotein [Bacilli bacterium]
MKKFIILFCLLLLVTGCNKKVENKEEDNSNQVEVIFPEKIDKSKDYVYFNDYKEYYLSDGSIYKLQIPIINYSGESASNVNLEIKTFINNSIKNNIVNNNVLSTGNVIKYSYYESDKYFTLIVNYTYMVDSVFGESKDYVYVFNLDSGKLLNNDEILELSGNDNLDVLLRNKIISEDIEFTIMTIKNNGYSLYFNDREELCIIYYEIDNLDNIRKELVL